MLEGGAQDLLGSEFYHYFKTEPLAGSVTLQMLGAQVREERRFVTLANNKGWCLLSEAENASSNKKHTASYLFLLTNITKQKEAGLLLQKAESQIQIIADRLPAMVAYIDRDLHFQFVNEQFEKLYQKPRGQFLGKTVLEALGNSEWQNAVIEQKGKGTVLLVEDDPEVLKLTRTILESAGYTVYAELEARKALQKNFPHIDLILSDVVMPTKSGPEFIAQC